MNTCHSIPLIVFPAMLIGLSTAVRAEVARAVSDDPFSPSITLSVIPPEGAKAFAVEETISSGARPTGISHDGVFDEVTGKIKWGPFTDADPRNFSYRLTGPAGFISLVAVVSYDGISEGSESVSLDLPDPSTTFFGWQFLSRSPRDFTYFPIDPSADGNRDGVTELAIYAFALSSEGSDPLDMLKIQVSGRDPPVAAIHAQVNANAADILFEIEATADLNIWAPIENLIPGIEGIRRAKPNQPGVDEIVYESVPLDPANPLIIRVRGNWLSEPDS